MPSRIPRSAAVAFALPSLGAGARVGMLLGSRGEEVPPRPAQAAARPTTPDPAPASAPLPADAPAPSAKASPATPTGTGKFDVAWHDLQEWLRGFDLKSQMGRDSVPRAELQKRSAALQQALMSDPDGYLAILRATENEPLFKFLLSILCRVVGLEGGHALLPLAQYPPSILDGVRDLLSSGTTSQKLGVLVMIQRESVFGEGHLIGKEALVERCTALLADPDPKVRATAVQLLGTWAPKQADGRFEVLQEVWGSSADLEVRSAVLQAAQLMQTSAAQEFLLKAVTQISADPAWTKDAVLMSTTLQAVQSRASRLKPEEEEGYAGVCASALRNMTQPMWYHAWMDVSLRLPLSRATALLEQAQTCAPTPTLQDPARRVLEQIRAGETRVDRLQATLREQASQPGKSAFR